MTKSVDVLIIGAGPTGACLAALLGQSGISTLVTDKAASIYPLPRAAHIDHEIVRVFQELGIVDEVMAASRPAEQYDFLTADGQVLMRFLTKGSPSGWPAANMIHQPSIEQALRRRIAGLSTVELQTSWELLDYTTSDHGVIARFQTPEGQAQMQARYLIGCDGASSRVRSLCSAAIEDLQFDEPWLVIDVLVHDVSRLPKINLQICDPARPTTCVLMGSGRHRWEFMLKAGETPDQVLDDAFIAELLKPWDVEGAISLERKAVYRFHALIAEKWRIGPIFLAGDAAHQMPPFAGQGLCSGVRDAVNLAWKLSAVIKGDADDRLLDTYQPERRPHVKAIIDLALMMGRTVCILDPQAADMRNKAMLAQRANAPPDVAGEGFAFPPLASAGILTGSAGAGELFMQPWHNDQRFDDVAGPGAWLITMERVEPAEGIRLINLHDPSINGFAGAFNSWLAKRKAASVLIRPDRYVFGTGAASDLIQAWRSALQ
jgi:3-(3-hydroxy-phenyl)propionate hydroxylase